MKIFGKYGKMKINEFIQKYRKVKKLVPGMTSSHTPYVICKDGFKMSVQVGFSLYSTPKKVAKRYSAVEIGFPSEREPLIEEYVELGIFDTAQGRGVDYTDTVYPYVPVKIVDKVLKKHGGIDMIETLSKV